MRLCVSLPGSKLQRLPYGKAMLYIAVAECHLDFEQPDYGKFLHELNTYFPFISFEAPSTYVANELNKIANLPTTIVKGTYNRISLRKFLKEANLLDLHDLFNLRPFQDLLFSCDLRSKIDGMSMAGFRHHEIELEVKHSIEDIDTVMVKTYLECFADYSDMDFSQKKNFINMAFEDMEERRILTKCIETKSKDTLRMLLGASVRTYDPIELMNRTARIVTLKTQEGLAKDNEVMIQSYLKLGIRVAEVLQKFDVGNVNAAEQLLAALSKKPEDVGIVSPKPKTVEELENMWINKEKPAPAS